VAMRKAPTSLHFSVDSASHRFVVNVTDNDTGELLRSLPGDAILKFAENLESLKGVLFDETF
jgi:flagellar protein FlaG